MGSRPGIWKAGAIAGLATLVLLLAARRAFNPTGSPSPVGGAAEATRAGGHDANARPARPPLPELPLELTGDLARVNDLLRQHQAPAAAIYHAYRTAWQAAEFRRQCPDPNAEKLYFEAVNDREKLHLELEFGMTNADFLTELLSLDVTEPPPNQRPELIVKTPEAAAVYDYHQRLQAETPAFQKLAGILRQHGIDAFPLLLRAAEDQALLDFCLTRQQSFADGYRSTLKGLGAPDAVANEPASDPRSIEALWNVLATSFSRMSGVADPDLYRALRDAQTGPTLTSPLRPPEGARPHAPGKAAPPVRRRPPP